MQTPIGHLTFCSNIFPGEDWNAHFKALRDFVPVIKKAVCPDAPFGIGLRLAHTASLALEQVPVREDFIAWLRDNDCYVFTINGFPYGNFHHSRVKDQVHAPDWTTPERKQYTLRLAAILGALLPEGMEGSISTSPLSYKPWFKDRPDRLEAAEQSATGHITEVIGALARMRQHSGKTIHLDIEPEADGLVESWKEFRDWFTGPLLKKAVPYIGEQLSVRASEAEAVIRHHLRLCYDVCHFAVGFEDMDQVLAALAETGIRIGKWQLSAAVKIGLSGAPDEDARRLAEISRFDEPVYLHQVVARKKEALARFTDLSDALSDPDAARADQWRSHFHVPLFVGEFGALGSTREDVSKALAIQSLQPQADHLEIETYTWDVLPQALKMPVDQSVAREMKWVLAEIARLHKNNA